MCYGDEPDIKADIERALRAVEHGDATATDAALLRWALNQPEAPRPIPTFNPNQEPF